MQFDEQDNKNTVTRQFHPLQFALIAISTVLLITLGIGYLVKPRPVTPTPLIPQAQPPAEVPVALPWKRYETLRGDTATKLFKRIGINEQTAKTIGSLSDVKTRLTHLKANQKVYVQFNLQLQLEKLIYMIDREHYLEVYKQDNRYLSKTSMVTLAEKQVVAKGTVQSTLSKSMQSAGLSHNQIASFINILNWEVNFSRQVHPGDQFVVVFDQYYSNNVKVKTGPILAAALATPRQKYQAFAFKGRNDQVNYFTPTGESMRKAFMRAPVHYKYISSPFSYRRWHPILHIVRAHEGVDFAAPVGTPIYAASDGVMTFRGRRGGYGKVVMLKHSHDVMTVYAHLSQFSSQFHVGSFVKEGQVIGLVGSTGMATGSHLHYEFRIHGIPYNPMTVKLPKADPIPRKDMPAFLDYVKKMGSILDQSITLGIRPKQASPETRD